MAGRGQPADLRTTFERALHEQRRALVGWSAGMATLAIALLALFPSIRGNASIAKLLDAYPETFRTMFNVVDFTTGPGYLRSEVFSFTGPLLVVILAVLWGSDAGAGEEERGTIDLLMANPIRRRRVVLEKWAAVCVGVAGVTATLGVVLGIGDAVLDLHVPADRLVAALVATGLLAVVFGTAALAVAAATGRPAVARGVAAAFAVASYLVSSLGDAVAWLRPMRPVSPWYHALGVDPIGSGFAAWHLAVLVLLVGCLAALAAAAFERRDLGVG